MPEKEGMTKLLQPQMVESIMKLIIRDLDGTETDITGGLPQQILWALHRGETRLVTQYIGWATNIAFLSISDKPKTLMRGEKEGGDAGELSVTLSNRIVARGDALENGFLPYMSYEERKRLGYTR